MSLYHQDLRMLLKKLYAEKALLEQKIRILGGYQRRTAAVRPASKAVGRKVSRKSGVSAN